MELNLEGRVAIYIMQYTPDATNYTETDRRFACIPFFTNHQFTQIQRAYRFYNGIFHTISLHLVFILHIMVLLRRSMRIQDAAFCVFSSVGIVNQFVLFTHCKLPYTGRETKECNQYGVRSSCPKCRMYKCFRYLSEK